MTDMPDTINITNITVISDMTNATDLTGVANITNITNMTATYANDVNAQPLEVVLRRYQLQSISHRDYCPNTASLPANQTMITDSNRDMFVVKDRAPYRFT